MIATRFKTKCWVGLEQKEWQRLWTFSKIFLKAFAMLIVTNIISTLIGPSLPVNKRSPYYGMQGTCKRVPTSLSSPISHHSILLLPRVFSVLTSLSQLCHCYPITSVPKNLSFATWQNLILAPTQWHNTWIQSDYQYSNYNVTYS